MVRPGRQVATRSAVVRSSLRVLARVARGMSQREELRLGVPVVVAGAQVMCSFGMVPAVLAVLPVNRVMVDKRPAATIQDHMPMVNIPTFGMCNSLANPVVTAATTAALGVLTPMPCVPATVSPWMPGAMRATAGKLPLLTASSQCNCMWGGLITVAYAGQATTTTS